MPVTAMDADAAPSKSLAEQENSDQCRQCALSSFFFPPPPAGLLLNQDQSEKTHMHMWLVLPCFLHRKRQRNRQGPEEAVSHSQ